MQRLPSFAGGKKIAGGKIYICRLSGKKFAVGQRDTCRWQTFHLPTANKKFAIGKWANVKLAIGKIKFSRRQIYILPSAKFMSDKWQM